MSDTAVRARLQYVIDELAVAYKQKAELNRKITALENERSRLIKDIKSC